MTRPVCWSSTPEVQAIIGQIRQRDFPFGLAYNHPYDPESWRPDTTEGWCIWDALEIHRGAFLLEHPGVPAKSLGAVIVDAVRSQLERAAA